MTAYPLSALRAVALHIQALTTPNGAGTAPSQATIESVVNQIGCVQIDTLQMVARSHYLALWSRLGSYAPADFDALMFGSQRRFFEGWQRAASIIPLAEYRYQMPHQRRLREHPGAWYQRWYAQPGHPELLEMVLAQVKERGALRVSDFAYDGPRRGSWWDWKPAKVALEYQYAYGNLMIANRVNFQRVYDLTSRVLPDWVDTREPTVEERERFWVERGVRALGVCLPSQAGDYTYRKVTTSRPAAAELLHEGVIAQVKGRLADEKEYDLFVHRDNLPLLEQAADGGLPAQRTAFLSPFDSLFWARRRDEQLFGFRQMLEAYKPAPQRIWGYYCLPILHHDRLVGRFDPKLERKDGTLRLKALYLEEGVEPEEALVSAVAAAMRDFMAFHRAQNLMIERSQPAMFGEKLLAAL